MCVNACACARVCVFTIDSKPDISDAVATSYIELLSTRHMSSLDLRVLHAHQTHNRFQTVLKLKEQHSLSIMQHILHVK